MSATSRGVDPALVTRIVDRVKSQGIFDQFRRDCLADVDTKPAYQNLGSRVEGYVSSFLSNFVWTADMNKNQLRNSLRKQINGSEMLASGVERIIEQVVDAQIQQIFLPRIETVVKEYLHSDNTSTSDVKATEPPANNSSSSSIVSGTKVSPTEIPLAGLNAATGSNSYPKPPPLPGETQDQPQPPPLPDPSSIQEKPKPPPLPRSRESSPPPLPPCSVPERRRTSSVSSTPSLDSISSDPLSIDSDDEKTKVPTKTTPAKTASPASSTKSTPGKTTPGKVALGKRRVILKKVVVRKADGTKVVRVVRMDPTKATAKKLLMRATSRAAGDQGSSPKGKTIIPARIKSEDAKKDIEGQGTIEKNVKQPVDDISNDVSVSPLLGKRKHTPMDDSTISSKFTKDSSSAQVHEEPVSSEEDESWAPRPERPKRTRAAFKREEIAAAAAHEDITSDSDEDYQPSPLGTKEDSLSKDLEDISSSGSDMDFEEANNSSGQRDYFPVDHSDSDSHISDVTVSSVHTSDLSSFDDKISSSSSSSSSSEEQEEEETEDYAEKSDKLPETSQADTKPASLMEASQGDIPAERSVSPASNAGGKTSPRLADEARWKRQNMADAEDEETKAQRRKRADTKTWIEQHHSAHGSKAKKAEAKEERARRRQQMKEQRERERESATSPSEIETRKSRRGRSEEDRGDSKPFTKQQLKEQKLQEKRREAKRQRSLLSQSDDSPACLDSKLRQDPRWTAPPILRSELILKKRKPCQIPFHHLLTLDMAYKQLLKKSQQRAKYVSLRAKEMKEGKKSYSRFNFQVPGKKPKTSRWRQVSAEQKKLKPERDEPLASETVEETVALDETEQLDEDGYEDNRLEMVSPVSPDIPSPEHENISRDTLRLETIASPEFESIYDEPKPSNLDNIKEKEPQSRDSPEDISKSRQEDMEAIDTTKSEIGIQRANENTASNDKMPENEAMEVMSNQENISSTATELAGTVTTRAGTDKKREIDDKNMALLTEETIIPERPQDEDGVKLEQEKETEEEQNDDVNVIVEQEVDREEGQISQMDDETIAFSVVEDTVPTFVVLEREEISSDEGDFEESDRAEDSGKEEAMKLPSIFQQTEAISSDEELDDVIPAPSAKETVHDDLDEEKSEGEVDEDAPAATEEVSLARLTEDISGDELSDSNSIENPPTPTLDEPAELEEVLEERNNGKASIPIVHVGSPKSGGTGVGRCSSVGSTSDAEGSRTRESTPKDDGRIKEQVGESKKEEIEEGELAEIEEGEVREEKEQVPGGRMQYRGPSDPPEEELPRYGKRPRRRTFSPHQGKDDEYLYFGLPKRTRRQSPMVSPASPPVPPGQGVVQRKPLTRERSRSGGGKDSPAQDTSAGDLEESVPSAPMERRSSRSSRRVSPPRRYSPSEQKTASRTKGQGSSTPAASVSPSPQEPDQPAPQQHRHFTRRMSGRDEERKPPHRYEDMYYYDNKRTKGNANTTSSSGKPTRRTSAEDRKRKR